MSLICTGPTKGRLHVNPQTNKVEVSPDEVKTWFHQLYYHFGDIKTGTWDRTWWMGWKLEKCPLDLWVYQELMFRIRPQLIVETGTRHGGSALFFCHMADLMGLECEIITIDIVPPNPMPQHHRLTSIGGSSTDPETVKYVHERAAGKSPVMVILDSDHHEPHVIGELRAYHDLVTPGSYLIVEDTNVNGHPVYTNHGPGPTEALEVFFRENQDYEVDLSCERHLLTMHPNGFLRKKVK